MSAGMRDTSVQDAHFEAAGDAATEGNPAAAAAATLRCLCDMSGATHGRLVWSGSTEHDLSFGAGRRPGSEPRSIALRIGGHTLGEVALWGADESLDVDAVAPAAARLALSMRTAELGHAVREQAAWRTAVASAVSALGTPRSPDKLTERAVAAAGRLLRGTAAVYVDNQGPEATMRHEGLYRVDEIDPMELLPLEARNLRAGATWVGEVSNGPLPRQGIAVGCGVGLGPRAGSRVLVVFSADRGDFGEAEAHALGDFGVSLTALLGAAENSSSSPGLVDSATGLPDRRYFVERLAQETARAERHLRSVSVLVLGLDASPAGEVDDDLLRLAELAVAEVRTSDVPCRVAPDTLGIIMADVETMDAVLIADRLRARVRESDSFSGPTTLSVGAGTFPARAGSAKELRQAAVRALGWARGNGGDRTFVYEREIAAALEDEEQSDEQRGDAIAESLRMLAEAVDGRRGADGHAQRVAEVSRRLALQMGLSSERAERLFVAAMLHDIGQISLSDEALASSEILDPEASDEVREHPDIGSRLLAGTPFNDVREWIRHHHERADGTGYPDRLAGESIPLEAQIIGVAEAFEELISDRPYRGAVSMADAMDEIRRCAGTQFNPAVVDALSILAERGELDWVAEASEGSE
jgi:diguanylate cyclase (GGDEF)-like protein